MVNSGQFSFLGHPPSRRLRSVFSLISSQRQKLAFVAALAACACMAIAAFYLRADPSLDPSSDIPGQGIGWAVLGALVFGLALWLARVPLPTPVIPTITRFDQTRLGWGWLAAGVLVLAVVTEMSVKLLGIDALYTAGPTTQFLLLFTALILLARGLGGAAPGIDWRGWKSWLPLIGILALALFLRLIWLGQSVHTLIDESQDLSGMQYLWTHPNDGLLKAASVFLPTTMVYSYWETVAVDLFGRTLFALRLTNAIVGTFDVLVIYLLAKALFDRPTALIAALLLATFPPAIHFSRLASAFAGTSLGALALAYAARGLRDNRRFDWAMCGLCLGLTQYFYEASRLLFPPLMLIWLGLMIVFDRRHLRAQWRGIVTAIVGALIVAAPVYVVIAADSAPVTSRFDDVGLGPDYWKNLLTDGISPQERDELVNHLMLPLVMMVHQPELATYYGGSQPLILDVLLPVGLLGAAFALWRARSPAALLPLWVLAVVIGNGLLTDNTQYPRYVVVFPALMLLMALGLRATVALLAGRFRWRWQAALLAGATAIIGGVGVHYYFFEHLPFYNAQVRNEKAYPDGTDAVFRALSLPDPTQIVMISEPPTDHHIVDALWGFLTNPPIDPPPDNSPVVLTPADVTPDWLASLPRDRDYAFFVAPGDEATVAALRQSFSLGDPILTRHKEIPPEKRFVLYVGFSLDAN